MFMLDDICLMLAFYIILNRIAIILLVCHIIDIQYMYIEYSLLQNIHVCETIRYTF